MISNSIPNNLWFDIALVGLKEAFSVPFISLRVSEEGKVEKRIKDLGFVSTFLSCVLIFKAHRVYVDHLNI